jgi:hypothetical protein
MRYIVTMEKKSTSIRIDEDARSRLAALSERYSVSITKLITLAAEMYAKHVEATGEIILRDPDRPMVVAEPHAEYGTPKKGKGK